MSLLWTEVANFYKVALVKRNTQMQEIRDIIPDYCFPA